MKRVVTDDQKGLCCFGYGSQPYLHAEDCPRRDQVDNGHDSTGFPDILFREDREERRQWDSMGERLGHRPLESVTLALDSYGRASPRQGSYGKSFFIMANDVAKADRVLILLEQWMEERSQILSGESTKMHALYLRMKEAMKDIRVGET